MNLISQHNDSFVLLLSLATLLAPLLSALLAWVISSRYAWIISMTAPVLLLLGVFTAGLLFKYVSHTEVYHFSYPWFVLGYTQINAGIFLDNTSLMMMFVVSVISFLVHLYSTGYMAGDDGFRRYFAMLGFFTFAMLGLVMAENLLLLFVFWELVGFSSYLLIGHWTDQPGVGKAARKAFMLNRVGDLGFIVAIMIVYANTGTLQLTSLANMAGNDWQTAASLFLFLGVTGKSAQFPLLTWLPDAMAGPTPVSALIHAATMVAAGIFLLAKVFFLFTPMSLIIVAVTGIFTALLGATAALFQFDIKKILAYSTLSQLGLMVVSIGVGAKESSILHLFTHAFFKAGLFLAAGSVIHALHQAQRGTHEHFDVQDIRNLGGLRKFLPVTFSVFVICGASLAGIPLMSGFLSKDAILAAITHWAGPTISWPWLMTAAAYLVSFLTVCYTYRLIWFVFIYPGRNKQLRIQETPGVMTFPMLVLAVCSLWWVVSWNPFGFSGWYTPSIIPSHSITVVSIVWVLCAFVFAFYYFKRTGPDVKTNRLTNLFKHTLFLDDIYHYVIVRPVNFLSAWAVIIDKRWIDGFLHGLTYAQVTFAHVVGWCDRVFVDGSVNGVAFLARGAGKLTGTVQGGKIQYYIFWAALGLIVLVFLFIS